MFILFLSILSTLIISYVSLYYLVVGLVKLKRYLNKRKCGLHVCLWCKYRQRCKAIDESGYFNIYKSIKDKQIIRF